MTPESEQLEAQSRAAIKAWCDDPNVQLEVKNKSHDGWFMLNVNAFDLDCAYYRIAKPKKWYRVAKMSGDCTVTADDVAQENRIESNSGFIEWIDDERKYYD